MQAPPWFPRPLPARAALSPGLPVGSAAARATSPGADNRPPAPCHSHSTLESFGSHPQYRRPGHINPAPASRCPEYAAAERPPPPVAPVNRPPSTQPVQRPWPFAARTHAPCVFQPSSSDSTLPQPATSQKSTPASGKRCTLLSTSRPACDLPGAGPPLCTDLIATTRTWGHTCNRMIPMISRVEFLDPLVTLHPYQLLPCEQDPT